MIRIYLSLTLMVFSLETLSDDHKKKGANKDMKKLKESMGYWKAEDCKNISDAAGLFLYYSYEVLEESSELREAGKELQADKLGEGGVALSQVAANYAKTFEAFCKR